MNKIIIVTRHGEYGGSPMLECINRSTSRYNDKVSILKEMIKKVRSVDDNDKFTDLTNVINSFIKDSGLHFTPTVNRSEDNIAKFIAKYEAFIAKNKEQVKEGKKDPYLTFSHEKDGEVYEVTLLMWEAYMHSGMKLIKTIIKDCKIEELSSESQPKNYLYIHDNEWIAGVVDVVDLSSKLDGLEGEKTIGDYFAFAHSFMHNKQDGISYFDYIKNVDLPKLNDYSSLQHMCRKERAEFMIE